MEQDFVDLCALLQMDPDETEAALNAKTHVRRSKRLEEKATQKVIRNEPAQPPTRVMRTRVAPEERKPKVEPELRSAQPLTKSRSKRPPRMTTRNAKSELLSKSNKLTQNRTRTRKRRG